MTNKKNNTDTYSNFTKELNAINDKVLNFAILVSALFSVSLLIIAIVRLQTINLVSASFAQFTLMLSTGVLFLTRNNTRFKFRLIAYTSILVAVVFSFALNFGMLGFWGGGIILITSIISIFYRKKYAFVILGILSIISGIIGYLFWSKYLVVKFDVLLYVYGYSIWVTMIITFLYISTIVIYTINMQRDFFVSSIKQLTLAKEKVQKSEQKFKTLFNSSLEGIAISDFEGNILEANKSLLDFMNVAKDQLRGKTVRDFVLPEYHAIMRERTESLVSNQPKPTLEMLLRNFKNEPILVEINMTLIDYNNDKAVFSVIRDITERKKEENNILSTIIQTEEKERSRFAKELHDGVGPLLSATKIYAKALPSADNEEERIYTIMKLNETVDEAIISAQEIANNISPHVLRNFGLKGAIESFYQKINKTSSLIFDFRSNLEKRIDENIETILYRIVVELINNTIKYAQAKLITIILMIDENKISLNYSDDGTGFDLKKVQEESTSMGLSNIYNRISSLNGQVNMKSEKNKGFEVDIKIDL